MPEKYLKPKERYFENSFYGRPNKAGISRESILLISALLKCLIYAISKNRSYDKALSKLPYLPNAFALFKNPRHFVFIDKSISFLLHAG